GRKDFSGHSISVQSHQPWRPFHLCSFSPFLLILLPLLQDSRNPMIKMLSSARPINKIWIYDQSLKVQRRDLLLHTVFGSLCLPAMVPFAFAEEVVPEGFQIYSDDVNKFKIMIPQVSVVITGLGADFTKLESFGKVDAFAENLVSGLDRSWQRPPGVSAKLIDSMYYIEYTLRNPGESERHLYSVLGIANNGWYNRLYTLTGQYLDEESEKYRSKIEKAVASFKLV
ncbi:Mog1/PsbP, alpha/beta/alpha sandwich, partial [Cynara cardunculus var. scolymus]